MMLNPSIIISQAMSWTCGQNCWKASHPCLRQWRACCRKIFFGIIGCAGRNNSLSIDKCWFVKATAYVRWNLVQITTVQSRTVFVLYWRLYCYPGAIHPSRALLLLIQICIRDRNSQLRHWGIPQAVVPVQKKSDSLLRPQSVASCTSQRHFFFLWHPMTTMTPGLKCSRTPSHLKRRHVVNFGHVDLISLKVSLSRIFLRCKRACSLALPKACQSEWPLVVNLWPLDNVSRQPSWANSQRKCGLREKGWGAALPHWCTILTVWGVFMIVSVWMTVLEWQWSSHSCPLRPWDGLLAIWASMILRG